MNQHAFKSRSNVGFNVLRSMSLCKSSTSERDDQVIKHYIFLQIKHFDHGHEHLSM